MNNEIEIVTKASDGGRVIPVYVDSSIDSELVSAGAGTASRASSTDGSRICAGRAR